MLNMQKMLQIVYANVSLMQHFCRLHNHHLILTKPTATKPTNDITVYHCESFHHCTKALTGSSAEEVKDESPSRFRQQE